MQIEDMVLNESFGIKHQDIPDGLYKFEMVGIRETISKRDEPCLVFKVRLLDIEKIYEFPIPAIDQCKTRLCDLFVSLGIKKRGVPIRLSEAVNNAVGKTGYIMIKDGFAIRFLDFKDLEDGYNDRVL